MSVIYVIKFYESQEDFDNKNPFHRFEMVGSLEEAKAQAEQIKEQLHAHSYKIKEKSI